MSNNTEVALPSLHIKCETTDGVVTGTTYLNVIRVEPNDDGSFTAVTDHWPRDASLQEPAVNLSCKSTLEQTSTGAFTIVRAEIPATVTELESEG